ncbi:hypothetical protein GA0070611_2296 [Micromonospora auratinigra]|uniref:Uncharacterized protein n=1 Tax=Micromonospora auratinigra TaxID=261654 RepID=A0A1A8ZHR1_9ACTN|nr:hypothetical protein GA0070611_2296 [Micromonospora auratinigra]
MPGSAAPGSPAASPPPAASPATSPARPVADPVSVRRTGGLAGVTQEITVDSDGRWRVRGPGTTAEQTGRLGAAQLTRLHLLLGDPSFGSAFYPGSCRDGFHYSLSSGARRVEWDDCGRPNPAEVAREIVALLVDATPF